jgi:putative transposase
MNESIASSLAMPAATSRDVLTGILRHGAQRMLGQAIEAEVQSFLESHRDIVDESGHRQVVGNGRMPARTIITGIGPMEISQRRVHDRRIVGENDQGEPVDAQGQVVERFSSKILPPYLRKTKSIEELIPWLYLKGVSTGDFTEALQALLGEDAPGLSAATITRLIGTWQKDFAVWNTRSLEGKQYVYFWVDGVHFNIRLEEDRQCILVIMGATADGHKELIALADGFRESEQSWLQLLLDCKQRGLTVDPKLAVADGALGFWKALPQVYPATREQRCWVHKTANVLDKMHKRVQPKAKEMLHGIWMAPTRAEGHKAFDAFGEMFEAKYPAAVECLKKDRDVLLAFYDFPAEHWIHIRTTNPIESTFATVRLRHRKTKGSGSRVACLTMVFKLMESASRTWRALNGSALVRDVIAGVQFADGVKKQAA